MRCFFLIAFVVGVHVAHAQQPVDSLRAFYIQEFPNHFFVWPVVKHRSLNFDVSARDNADRSIVFKPNNTAAAGFGFYLFEIVFEIAFAIPINEEAEQIFGETKARDLQLNVLTKSWGVDLYHQRYSGFYRDDERVKSFIDGPPRADIDTRNFGISGVYVLNNRKFSLRSAYNYAERQLKSKGSFIIYGTINAFKVGADSAVLSSTVHADFGGGSNFEDLKCTTLSFAPGYSYNFVLKKFFVNATVTLGPAHHWVYYKQETGEEHYDVSFNATSTVRLAIGYNSDRIFGGLGFNIQSRAVTFENVRFENASTIFKVLIGYRFKEKGVLKKKAWEFLPRLNK
jgi:hypothetical protein